jgi:glutamate-1-semialdehyde 2,1-aminomutase
MGFIPPADGFLKGLRDITRDAGALLIFDEVMTGFRISTGGAQQVAGVMPDLTCMGKVIGGGLPVGAYGGKKEIMQTVAPAGPMYQAGTLSGNPLAMIAGLVTLQEINKPGAFEAIAQNAATLVNGLKGIAAENNIPVQAAQEGSMFGVYFLKEEGQVIDSYEAAREYAHTERFAKFFWSMAEHGVYFAPSQFEVGFMSSAHGNEEIDHTLSAAREVFKSL